ncbi:aldo/keto reductase [Profundibacterium mesophilum]|uniref:1-deoxy-D-xylulose-5-phosphate reductoisomerase n=1 Tax=Profundibacterium mesophilum KAUST100406-0324 TaxID=1037889 RepID=A0A921TEZ9_9RHOB|nr:aldo/keto reductase [Profundibacterium mesophilum]KAF0675959.1 1-deoxy-D-xylulose-5-phosphate reductoisomerase [Profundibacterium mesophilum KAUST100406-0324]
MKYRQLGQSGLYVSELTLGTMTFDNEGGSYAGIMGATGQELATRMVDLSIEAGINIFDTANVYSSGVSEEMLGRALGARRKDMLIATKLASTLSTGPNDLGSSRLAIMREVEASLKRLGTDYIDLYQVHTFDYTTPLEETLRALDDLVRQGKVRYIGLSNFAGWQIAKADGLARQLGCERFVSAQSYYSLVGRELEREILPAVRDLGLGTFIYSPLASGFLSGKYARDGEAAGRRSGFDFPPVDKDQGFGILDVLAGIAEAKNASVAQVALAWLLHKPGVTSVIVGARKQEQLVDNLGAADIALGDEEMARLDAVSALRPEYPGYLPRMRRGDSLFARRAG